MAKGANVAPTHGQTLTCREFKKDKNVLARIRGGVTNISTVGANIETTRPPTHVVI